MKKFISAVLAGMCIAIGGCAFLSLDSKILGALFFTVGLFTICTFGFDLFTGKVCYVPNNGKSYAAYLPVIWLGNLLGAWLTAQLFLLTRIAPIAEKAAAMCEVKLGDSLPSIFILSIFCNLLIYIAVDGFKNNPHELGKYLSLFFGVMVFILCGFEHCVANMFYISAAGMWSAHAVLMIIVNTLGNCVGGLLIPLTKKFILSD